MFYTLLGEELERRSEMCTVVQKRKGGEKIHIYSKYITHHPRIYTNMLAFLSL